MHLTPEGVPLLSILQAAGWPIIPLLLVSIVALALIVERLLSLRIKRIAPPSLVDEVIGVTKSHLPTADTISKLAASNSTLRPSMNCWLTR